MPRPLLIRVDDAPTWDDLHRRAATLATQTTGIEWAVTAESIETLRATKPANPIAPDVVGCVAVHCPHATVAESKDLIVDALEPASSLGASALNVSILSVGGPRSDERIGRLPCRSHATTRSRPKVGRRGFIPRLPARCPVKPLRHHPLLSDQGMRLRWGRGAGAFKRVDPLTERNP